MSANEFPVGNPLKSVRADRKGPTASTHGVRVVQKTSGQHEVYVPAPVKLYLSRAGNTGAAPNGPSINAVLGAAGKKPELPAGGRGGSSGGRGSGSNNTGGSKGNSRSVQSLMAEACDLSSDSSDSEDNDAEENCPKNNGRLMVILLLIYTNRAIQAAV